MEHLKTVTSNKGFEKGNENLVHYLVLFENTAEKELEQQHSLLTIGGTIQDLFVKKMIRIVDVDVIRNTKN